MNKYINSFEDQLRYSSGYSTISRPSVTYLKDSGDVLFKDNYHAPTEDKTQAHVGDLVFMNDMIYTEEIEGDKPLYMDPRDPRVSMMRENDTCAGVVVSLPGYANDGKIRIVSLDFMNYNEPQNGSQTPVDMMWGKTNALVSNLNAKDKILSYSPGTTTLVLNGYSYFGTDFSLIDCYTRSEDTRLSYDYYAGSNSMIPSPYNNSGEKNDIYFSNTSSILSDGLCGESNTDKIINMSSAEIGDSSFSNQQEVYPAAMCCRSYFYDNIHNEDGDSVYYYLPSIAELGLLAARIEEINFARNAVGYSNLTNMYLWSSS